MFFEPRVHARVPGFADTLVRFSEVFSNPPEGLVGSLDTLPSAGKSGSNLSLRAPALCCLGSP